MKKIIAVIGLVAVILLGDMAAGRFYSINRVFAESGVTVGKEMPVFQAVTLDGQSMQVGGNGIPYVLNFWASWCPPCREEFPELNVFASAHTDDLQYYGINIEESQENIQSFFQRNGYQLPVLLDTDGSIARQFRVRTLPTTFIVDSQGIIRYRKTGEVTKQELENVLAGL